MRRLALAVTVGAALIAAVLSAPASTASPAVRGTHGSERTCPAAPVGFAACLARVVTGPDGKPVTHANPAGYGPSELLSAYNLPASTTIKTVAIVDAYDDPTAESDLATYRSTFGLSPCTTANGCFKKVNQSGGTSYPRVNAGWATEISLDLDMVSAICPTCHILLVEATSSSFSNLATAVTTASKAAGVIAISNSYGGSDTADTSLPAYNTAAGKGIAVTASTGDGGYGVESPASFKYVVAVGGTSLTQASNSRGWAETVWSGAGSGCSTKNTNPGWQLGTQCPGNGKANADVSAVADPNTGVAVYDTTKYQGRSGWQVYGGTSVASPIIASVYAMAGNFGTYAGQYTWGHSGGLNDVTSGSNGSCSPALWCTGESGWDGPTGLGTPNGTTAF